MAKQRIASPQPTSRADALRKIQILDGTALKLIALVSMVLDHVGDLFFPEQIWMRAVGRLAMPIFCFCVAEAYIHTRDRRAYLERLALFALISELPFDFAFSGGIDLTQQNIMFTFALAVVALMAYDYLYERQKGGWRGVVVGSIAVAAIGLLSILLGANYNFTAVGLVFVFYVLREQDAFIRNAAAVAFEALVRNVGIYRWGVLSFFPLMMYNGKRGRGLKLFFYPFYPGHMLVLALLKMLLTR